MFQIRRGIFETNSSSSHSITISKTGEYSDFPSCRSSMLFPTLKIKSNSNVIEMTGGEFGWGVEQFNDFNTKFQYLITSIFGNCDSESDVKKLMKTSNRFELLRKVITEYCDAEIVHPEPSNYKGTYVGPVGYIDHESVGVARQAFISKHELLNYLFNTDSILYIDNDNH